MLFVGKTKLLKAHMIYEQPSLSIHFLFFQHQKDLPIDHMFWKYSYSFYTLKSNRSNPNFIKRIFHDTQNRIFIQSDEMYSVDQTQLLTQPDKHCVVQFWWWHENKIV